MLSAVPMLAYSCGKLSPCYTEACRGYGLRPRFKLSQNRVVARSSCDLILHGLCDTSVVREGSV
jgi:hypothetical protein